MTTIVGANGEPIDMSKLRRKPRQYEVEGVGLVTPDTPVDMLGTALDGARRMTVMQVAQQVVAQGGTQQDGITRGQTEASKIVSLFQIEPAAGAIFMLLSRHIKKQEEVIGQLYDEIDALRKNAGLPKVKRLDKEHLDEIAAPVVDDGDAQS